jgi:hypothetical protein
MFTPTMSSLTVTSELPLQSPTHGATVGVAVGAGGVTVAVGGGVTV